MALRRPEREPTDRVGDHLNDRSLAELQRDCQTTPSSMRIRVSRMTNSLPVRSMTRLFARFVRRAMERCWRHPPCSSRSMPARTSWLLPHVLQI